MAFGYVLIRAATYGGLYYTANFTATGTQPTWTKITTTGLPAVTDLSWLAVDPFNPRDRQVVMHSPVGSVQSLYGRNAGNWSLLINATIAKAATGEGHDVTVLTSPWFDPLVEGKLICLFNTADYEHWAGVSTDYGANWSAFKFYGGANLGEIKSLGAHYWEGANGNIGVPVPRVAYTPNSGSTLKYTDNLYAGAATGPPVVVDKNDPTICYTFNEGPAGRFDLVRVDGDSASPMTLTTLETHIAERLGGTIQNGDAMWIDPYNSAHMRLLSAYDGLVTPTLKATTDTWGTLTTGAALGYLYPRALTHIQNTGDTTVAVFGDQTAGGVSIACLSTETDYTPEARSGANAGSAPYADSIPQVAGTTILANYGIWVGEQPVTTGVFVYADEQESVDNAWATDIADYDNLGSPMGGDRSSFRDMPADGFDVYHAEDVHAATPQIHAPWDEASPPGAGYGIVSDGSKWVVSSAPLATTSSLHDAVTLDADAAVILDLSGQEIGLDTQTANTVLAGPATGAANEPTFRALVAGDLPAIALNDLSDVDTTGLDADDILVFDGASWVDRRPNYRKRITITADTTLDDTYDVVIVDATSNDVDVQLPNTATVDEIEYAIKRIDSSANTVAVLAASSLLIDDNGDHLIDDNSDYLMDDSGGSDTIDGNLSVELDQYSSMQIVADADAKSWWII